MWHRLIEHFHLPLAIPTGLTPNDIAADELQHQAIRALRLRISWQKDSPKIKRFKKIHGANREQCLQLQFLPGGKWLLTVQRYHRLLMTRFTLRVSVWSLLDLNHPESTFSVELEGIWRCSGLFPIKGDQFATLVIGLNEGNDSEFVHPSILHLLHSSW